MQCQYTDFTAELSRFFDEVLELLYTESEALKTGGSIMTFGQILQRERTAAGLTQAQLAELCGVPLGTLRDYEQGKRNPLFSTAAKIARGLHKSLDLFDAEAAAPEPPPPRGRTKKAPVADQAEPVNVTKKKTSAKKKM